VRRQEIGRKIKQRLTNNEAEYAALLVAAVRLKMFANPLDKIYVHTDSALVANQMNGHWKINKEKFVEIKAQVERLLKDMDVHYVWITRDKNKEADEIAQQARESKDTMLSLPTFARDD
jgi:ribonuclease HI